MINLDGYCPRGCGQTLRAEETRAVNRIVCWGQDCPEPLAAQKKLENSGCVPGDRSEELPAALLSVIDPPPYLSTACLTADACIAAIENHPDLVEELSRAAATLWERCRRTQKFTGQDCAGFIHRESGEAA
jgi:hypothetical protein